MSVRIFVENRFYHAAAFLKIDVSYLASHFNGQSRSHVTKIFDSSPKIYTSNITKTVILTTGGYLVSRNPLLRVPGR